MSIVMTGATGSLGKIILRQLLYRKRPENIIVSVRKPEAAEALKGQGVDVRYGDYEDKASLVGSFRGASKLLLISSPHPDDSVRLRHHLSALDAAKEAGIRHIIYTSIAFLEQGQLPLHRLHLDTEKEIRESGIPFTFLRNGYYMDILRFLGVREAAASGVLLSPPGDWSFNTTAREDLALAAAAVLTEEGPTHTGRTYELTASRTWSLSDLARAIAEATGRRVVHRTDPAAHNPIYGLLPLSEMGKVSPDLERLAGRPLRSLQEEVRSLLNG
ncbi:NmrA family NAD(P)-binding protein [Paenibacillus sp. NPDC056579]|uniref:NmrA family NAD(P)-binding protein n=1 Tax=Paenibacillus sp. NPDC056579 TaxID=3345871 RepID=UPI0036B4BCD6